MFPCCLRIQNSTDFRTMKSGSSRRQYRAGVLCGVANHSAVESVSEYWKMWKRAS